MSDTGVAKRPGGVTLVALLIFIAAIFNLLLGVWMVLAPLGQNPTISDVSGNTVQLPTFWLLLNGALSVLLGLIYLWLGRMTMAGSASAQVLIQVLAVINIVFALFRLPYGWIAVAVNGLILLLVSTAKAKAWFTRMP